MSTEFVPIRYVDECVPGPERMTLLRVWASALEQAESHIFTVETAVPTPEIEAERLRLRNACCAAVQKSVMSQG